MGQICRGGLGPGRYQGWVKDALATVTEVVSTDGLNMPWQPLVQLLPRTLISLGNFCLAFLRAPYDG